MCLTWGDVDWARSHSSQSSDTQLQYIAQSSRTHTYSMNYNIKSTQFRSWSKHKSYTHPTKVENQVRKLLSSPCECMFYVWHLPARRVCALCLTFGSVLNVAIAIIYFSPAALRGSISRRDDRASSRGMYGASLVAAWSPCLGSATSKGLVLRTLC